MRRQPGRNRWASYVGSYHFAVTAHLLIDATRLVVMAPREADDVHESQSAGWLTTDLGRSSVFAAALALLVGWLASYFSLFHYRPGGGMFPHIVAPIILALFTFGLAVALRLKTLGGLICIGVVAAAIPIIYYQLVPYQAVLMVVALGIPALGLFTVGLRQQGKMMTALAVAVAVAASALAFRTVWDYYQSQWGPVHGESALELEPSDVLWVWAGGVTTDQAEITAKTVDADSTRLAFSTDAAMASPDYVEADSSDEQVASFFLDGLQAETEYHYAVEVDGQLDTARMGQFETFPEGPASFVLAFGSCARTGSSGSVFDTIRGHDPLMYLIAGDFFYGDIPDNDPSRFEEIFDVTLTAPSQSELYRSTSIGYVWDDHDFGPNNSDSTSNSREAALSSYRKLVPSYPLTGPTAPIYQAFTIGRVRVVMTDSRSARIPNETMLGADQKQWLKTELVESAKNHAVVIWLNPDPWVGDSGSDYWAEFPDERAELSQVLADANVNNLVMVSGDAHMVALDDGTNTNYSTKEGKGFPLLHVAALDRPGSTRGGPYSHGKFPGTGQFGLVEITDDGTNVSVVLEGRTWEDEILTSLTFEPELPPGLSS